MMLRKSICMHISLLARINIMHFLSKAFSIMHAMIPPVSGLKLFDRLKPVFCYINSILVLTCKQIFFFSNWYSCSVVKTTVLTKQHLINQRLFTACHKHLPWMIGWKIDKIVLHPIKYDKYMLVRWYKQKLGLVFVLPYIVRVMNSKKYISNMLNI